MSKKNKHSAEDYFHGCLYFTASSLARIITQMADEEFRSTGLSPTYAFLIMLVNDKQGISPSELSQKLNLAPSTITRLIDKLEIKGIIERKSEGKSSMTYSTDKGIALQKEIEVAWKRLHERYSEALGKKKGDELNKSIDMAVSTLTKK